MDIAHTDDDATRERLQRDGFIVSGETRYLGSGKPGSTGYFRRRKLA